MNNLSWMIYAADIAGTLNEMLQVTFIASVVMIFGTLVSLCAQEDWYEEEWALWRKFLWRSLIVAAFSTFVGAIVPDSSTIYAIAASEMGESVLNSETGGKAVDALNAWLDRQIEGDVEQ